MDDSKSIARNYITGWFFIDLISIFPFNIIWSGSGGGGDVNGMAKITRIGRIGKLVRLTRLLRILKILKARSKLLKYAQEWLRISVGFERLFIFSMGFVLLVHIASCLWVMMGIFDGV